MYHREALDIVRSVNANVNVEKSTSLVGPRDTREETEKTLYVVLVGVEGVVAWLSLYTAIGSKATVL